MVLSIMELRSYARAHALVTAPDLDEEAIQKQGVPQTRIDQVMENIQRFGEEGWFRDA